MLVHCALSLATLLDSDLHSTRIIYHPIGNVLGFAKNEQGQMNLEVCDIHTVVDQVCAEKNKMISRTRALHIVTMAVICLF